MMAEKEMAKTTPRAAMMTPESAPRRRVAAVIGGVLRGFPAYGKRMENVWVPYGT